MGEGGEAEGRWRRGEVDKKLGWAGSLRGVPAKYSWQPCWTC